MAAQRRTYRIDEMAKTIAELFLARDKALSTRSPALAVNARFCRTARVG
jgi:hypothetical protein